LEKSERHKREITALLFDLFGSDQSLKFEVFDDSDLKTLQYTSDLDGNQPDLK